MGHKILSTLLNLFVAKVIRRLTPRYIRRRNFALSYYKPKLRLINKWQFLKTEDVNFYYELEKQNESDLASLLSLITKLSFDQVLSKFDELKNNVELRTYIANHWSDNNNMRDSTVGFGRRLGWYALVRILKPKIVVETGVSDGIGSLVIATALIENAKEGSFGRYYGTDLDMSAGWLFREPYSRFGEILYGDSIESLAKFQERIDLFINDSDHSAEYEYKEYESIKNKLSPNSFLLGDNSHVTDSLRNFSNKNGRNFVFFREVPRDHWYPGAGIGISFISE